MNKRIYYIFIATILSCFVHTQSFAQTDEPVKIDPPKIETVPNDEDEPIFASTKSYEKRDYDAERLNALRRKKEFQYESAETEKLKFRPQTEEDRKYDEERNNNRQRKREIKRYEYKKPMDSTPSQLNVSWLFILLGGVLLVLLIMYFLGFKPSSFFKKNNMVMDEAENPLQEENIHTIKFETELEKAIRNKNYKLAVRILYLESLKKLNDHQLINWQKNKTNWDYVNEIGNADLKSRFKKITNGFDYVWYGNFQVDEATFHLMQEQMETFKNKII